MKGYQFIFLILIFFSCNNEEDSPQPKPGYDYFPIQKGYFRDYKIKITKYYLRPDSVLNKVVPDSTKRTVYTHEFCTLRFLDEEGDSASRIEIFTKNNLIDNWPVQPDSIAIVKIKDDELIYTINNRTYVKILFPVRVGLGWNGNKFNSMGEEFYTISEIGATLELADTVLSPSMKIVQSNIFNLIEVDERTEVYALNVGLAEKNTRILQYRQSNGEVLTGEIESGTVFKQELIDYGEN